MPKHDDMVGSWHWEYHSLATDFYLLKRENVGKAIIDFNEREPDEDLLDLICTLLNENELPPRTVEATVKDEAGGVKREYSVRDSNEMMKALGITVKRPPNKRGEGQDV